MQVDWLLVGGAYIGVINLLAFVFFGLDKALAGGRAWRIPEKTLWFLALIGGSLGALVGMNFFRHKTKKTRFQLVLALIVFMQALALWLLVQSDIL